MAQTSKDGTYVMETFEDGKIVLHMRPICTKSLVAVEHENCIAVDLMISQLENDIKNHNIEIARLKIDILCSEKIVNDAFAVRERLGVMQGQVAIYEPFYRCELAKIEQMDAKPVTQANYIGTKGEVDVFTMLTDMIGGTAGITVTNRSLNAGDLQISFPIHGATRPALITVEIKTSDSGKLMVRQGFIDQASAQVYACKADAGLLLYSHDVSPREKMFVLESRRLVVCGNYRDFGLVMSAVLTTLIIAQKNVLLSEHCMSNSVDALNMTEEDIELASETTSSIISGFGRLRKRVCEINALIKSATEEDRKLVVDIIGCVSSLPDTARRVFPMNMMQILQVPRERLLASTKRKLENNLNVNKK